METLMRSTTLFVTIITCLFLSGCFLKQPKNSKTNTSLVIPGDIYIKQKTNLVKNKSLPSNQFRNQNKLRLINQNKLVFQPAIGTYSFIMLDNISQAWMKIGRALRKTSYQVLDQDITVSSFYILDTESTNNKITKATPIYRVYLKSRGEGTQVFLLNKNNLPAIGSVSYRILLAIQKGMAE